MYQRLVQFPLINLFDVTWMRRLPEGLGSIFITLRQSHVFSILSRSIGNNIMKQMSNVGINPPFSAFKLFCSKYWILYFFVVQGHRLLFLSSNVSY